MNRRDFINFLKTAAVAVPVSALTTKIEGSKPASMSPKDFAERILDMRTLRCGYINYAKCFMKDPVTGKKSGIFYDLTERLGYLLDLDIEWTTETTYATFTEDLKLGKFDMYGGGVWANPQRSKRVNFSLPAFYSGIGIYVRGSDHRFDNAIERLNNPEYRLATIDGEMSHIVQQSDFPHASTLSLPDNTDIGLLAENVAHGKADATIIEKAAANLYLAKHPGALRNVADTKPLRVFKTTWAFAYGSERFKNVVDTAVEEILSEKHVDKILRNYSEMDDFYRVRSPIQ